MKANKSWKQIERTLKKVIHLFPKEKPKRRLSKAERKKLEMWDKIISEFNHDLMEYW